MSDPFYILSDSACRIKGHSYSGIPVVIGNDGRIHEPMTDYLRYLRGRGKAESSIKEYAKILVSLLAMLVSQDQADWMDVSDNLLVQWRNWLADERRPGHVQLATVNRMLTIVFGFYLWAEKTGRLDGHLGVPGEGKAFPMTAEIADEAGHRRGSGSRLVSPLTFPTVRKPDDRNPTQEEITLLHVALSCHASDGLNDRDTLMARWAEATLRRLEFARLLVSELPDRLTADENLRANKMCLVALRTTKGMKSRVMTVDPILVLDTWKYVDGPRAETVVRFRQHRAGYVEPNEIFLSTKTGNALQLNSISNLATSAMRRSGVKNGNMHRMRSVGITDRIERVMDHYEATHGELPSFEAVWLVVQQEVGHAYRQTTERYFRACIKLREARALGSTHQIATAEARLRDIKRKIAREEAKLANLRRQASELTV